MKEDKNDTRFVRASDYFVSKCKREKVDGFLAQREKALTGNVVFVEGGSKRSGKILKINHETGTITIRCLFQSDYSYQFPSVDVEISDE